MDNAHAQGAWTISEVERLTGLPRRDIQRCCYNGKGGLGIVEVQNSTWGRRCYSVAEMAALYVVQLERLTGESLPEIARKLCGQAGEEPFEPADHLAVQAARLEERSEAIAGQLARARALRIALQEDDPQSALGALVERCVGDQLVAALRTLAEKGVCERGQTNVAAGRKALAPNDLCGLGSALDTGWLARELSRGRTGANAARRRASGNRARPRKRHRRRPRLHRRFPRPCAASPELGIRCAGHRYGRGTVARSGIVRAHLPSASVVTKHSTSALLYQRKEAPS